MRQNDIATPAILIDRELFEENSKKMQEIISGTSMALYPHYKSHKCVRLAAYQMAHGAKGITCAKLSEAEDLVSGGIRKVVIANQIVQMQKLRTLALLAKQADITVCADSAGQITALEQVCSEEGSKLRVLVEYEVGMRRCGVESFEDCLALARLILKQPHLTFEGIQAYAGQLAHESDAARRKSELMKIEELAAGLKQYLESNHIAVAHVCGGSTGTAADKPKDTVYTQLQAGSYLLMDASYQKLQLDFAQAMRVMTTVISVKADRVVVDCGVKSLAMDQYPPYFVGFENCELSFSEEHTTIFTDGKGVSVGDKIFCVPGHCCTTNNCFEKLYLMDGDEVAEEWPIVSRGKAQ